MFVLISQTYHVKGLPKNKLEEITNLIVEFSGTMFGTKHEKKGIFSCKITINSNDFKSFEEKIIEICNTK